MSKTAKEILTEASLADTHWGERIIAAEERGSFSFEDCVDAGEWTTCACGKQDPRIPREFGIPIDSDLKFFGVRFHANLVGNDFVFAASYLIAIEKRAGKVLAEVLS